MEEKRNEIYYVEQTYLIIDCPGQIELYIHHEGFKNIVEKLTGKRNCNHQVRIDILKWKAFHDSD